MANEDIHKALANTVFRDEQHRNDAVLYLGWLQMFDLQEETEVVLNALNGGLSINMASRSQAMQSHVGMVFPSISGMKVSKDELKYMGEANVERAKAKRHDGDEEDDGEKK